MKFKAPPLDIPDDNPFANDALDRAPIIRELATFVNTIQEPFVIALDGNWGTGKTTFVKMWQAHIRPHSHSLYFNAWESDFTVDPLLALIGETKTLLDDLAGEHRTSAENHLNKVREYAGWIARVALPAVVNIATRGALNVSSENESVIASLLQSQMAKAITRYEKSTSTIQGFKKELTRLIEEILNKHESKNEQLAPVVFFIDELDRCRPLYAVELLERVKHLFDIPGIVFVISLCKDQLAHSLRCVYGQGIDVDGYLRRFIDLEYHLPEPPLDRYHKHLYDRFQMSDFFENRVGNLRKEKYGLDNYLPRWCDLFELSLRDIEKCYTQIAIACRMTESSTYLLPHLLSLLVVLKLRNAPLYLDYTMGRAGFEEVIAFIREQPQGERFLADSYGWTLEGLLLSCVRDEHEYHRRLAAYEDQARQQPHNKEFARCGRIIDVSREMRRIYNGESPLLHIARRIDIAAAIHTVGS